MIYSKYIRTLASVTLFCASFASLGYGQVVFEEDFESYTAGQPITAPWGNSPTPYYDNLGTVQTGIGVDTTKVFASAASGSGTSGAYETVSLGLGSYTGASFSMDFLSRGDYSTVMVGMTPGGSGTGFAFGENSKEISFRPSTNIGTITKLYTGASTQAIALDDTWYNLTANIDFSGSTATITEVWLTNLTAGGPAQQLYFDSAGTVTSIALLSDESTWNRVNLRTSNVGNAAVKASYVDNVKLTIVPEPSSTFLLAGGLLGLLLHARRMRGNASAD